VAASDNPRTIAEAWLSLSDVHVPEGWSAQAAEVVRIAFYGGAFSVLKMMEGIEDRGAQSGDLVSMVAEMLRSRSEWVKEINRIAGDLGRRSAERN
jgi:hypothetical protein